MARTTELRVSLYGSADEQFSCNYCHCPSTGPPILLGRSARLACSQCASTIVKLSICWVCGEMICRGDDCVSFGWCFWHRTCYSCLLCGSRRMDGVARDRDQSGRGPSEVMEPPLCGSCDSEAKDESSGRNRDAIGSACLEFVDSVDGGFAKLRWQAMQHGSLLGGESIEAIRGVRDVRIQHKDMVIGEAGNRGTRDDWKDQEGFIWVDMTDPVNRPAFRPHPLKPVPTCMTRRTSN